MAGRRSRRVLTALALVGMVAGGTFATTPGGAVASHINNISVTPLTVFPAFDEDTFDYAMRCAAGANVVDVVVDAPTATSITVDGAALASGVSTQRTVNADDTIVVAVTESGVTDEYWYRCLPDDFPTYTIDKPGSPGPGFYLIAFGLCFTSCPTTGGSFVAIMDTNGVPVWYKRTRLPLLDQKLLSDGNIAYIEAGPGPRAYQFNSLDGSLQRMVRTDGIPTDIHELWELANGHHSLMSYVDRPGADLTSIGLTDNETAIDGYIQEIDAAGNALWEWRSNEHIDPEENLLLSTDLVHLNSIDEFPDGDLLVSGRSVGVYRIDRATGNIEWKLGGTTTPESLEIVGDTELTEPGPIRMHDARVLPDGSIFIFDNRQPGEVARAVNYVIDTAAVPDPTATMVWEYDHIDGIPSLFMGSARRQPDGNTVINWGGRSPMLEEIDGSGTRQFVIEGPGEQQYRVVKYPLSAFDIATLRSTAGGLVESDAPTDVAATPGDRQATVSWTAPSIGQPITGYTVTSQPGGHQCTTSGATSCVVTGLTTGEAYTFVVHADNVWGSSLGSLDSNEVTPADLVYVPLSSFRFEDTRGGVKVGSADGSAGPLRFGVLGRGGVPASGVGAVSLNVTVVGGELPAVGGGFVTVDGCVVPRPVASNINFGEGDTIANSVITPVSAAGEVCVYVYGTADVLVDVNGYFPDVSDFGALSSFRFEDTRGGVKVGSVDGSAGPLRFGVLGRGGVPASGVGAVSLNVTVVGGELPAVGGGFVTVDGCAVPRPVASNINFGEGDTIANSVITPVSAAGEVCVYVYGTADVLVDVNGYFPDVSDFGALSSFRFEDTRGGVKVGSVDGSAGPLRFGVLGRGGVPASGVGAVSLNVTVVGGELPAVGGGFVTVDGCAVPRPVASNINFGEGDTIANSVITPVSAAGEVCVYVYGTADVLVDVNGYFPDSAASSPAPALWLEGAGERYAADVLVDVNGYFPA